MQLTRLLSLTICLALCWVMPLSAQETPPETEKPSEDKKDSGAISEEAIAEAIKKHFPQLDLEKKHNIRSIANPSTEDERFQYTQDMIEVVRIWITTGQGATLEKIIDSQIEEKTDNPVLYLLAGFFASNYPPGNAQNP